MSLRGSSAPLWLIAAIAPMLLSQIIRLHQSDPAAWVFWDYAGRLGALSVLAAVPSARTVSYQREALRISAWETVLWIVGIVLVDHYLCGWIRRSINAALPATVLGVYPQPHGWLNIFDIVFGLALVAYSEETVFRRCAGHVVRSCLKDRIALVAITSILFGLYHWWTGAGNIVEAILIGALLMLFYQRSRALWPAVVAHYLTDIVDFGLASGG